LSSVISPKFELISESDFPAFDAGTLSPSEGMGAIIDLPDNYAFPFTGDDSSEGRHLLLFPEGDFADVERQGVLFAASPNGESQVVHPVQGSNIDFGFTSGNPNRYFDSIPGGQTVELWVYDVNSGFADFEEDSVSWVYLPFGTTVTRPGGTELLSMGIFDGGGDGRIESTQFIGQGVAPTVTTLVSDGDAGGAWLIAEVTHPEFNPTNSVFYAQGTGGSSQSQDNVFTYRINENNTGWIVETRDGPSAFFDALASSQYAFSYMFLPLDATDFDEGDGNIDPNNPFVSSATAALFKTDEYNGGNGFDGVRASKVFGGDIELVSNNRGDFGFNVDGLSSSIDDGFIYGQVAELGRQPYFLGDFDDDINTDDTLGFGGLPAYFTVNQNVGNTQSGIALERLDNGFEGNANFAIAYIPDAAGFPQGFTETFGLGSGASQITDLAGNGLTVTDPVVDFDPAEGVLITGLIDTNFEAFASVSIDDQAGNYTLFSVEADSTFDPGNGDPIQQDPEFNLASFTFFPYNTRDLVAGRIAADGTILGSTGGMSPNFSVTAGSITEVVGPDTEFTVSDGPGIEPAGFPGAPASTIIPEIMVTSQPRPSGDIITNTRTGYNLVIPGVDSNSDGVLLLQGVGSPAAGEAVAMQYAPNADGSFDILAINPFSVDVPRINTPGNLAQGAGYFDGDPTVQSEFMFVFIPNDGLVFEEAPVGNPLDFDGNGVVNISDLFAFITAFTMTPPAPTTDFDGNGVINISDLFAFITAFTAQP
ncbi:MAG: GC-type dockerin domain-anchored protein, partial [Planctomycetota bacterium]